MKRTKQKNIKFSVVYEHTPLNGAFTVVGTILFDTYEEAAEIGRLTALDASYAHPVVVKHIIAVPV